MPGDNPTVIVDAHVTAKDMAVATAHATLEMPQHLFDPAAWLSLGANAVRGASLNIDGAMLDTELTRRFGIVAPLAGHATFAVEVTPGLTSATATLHVDKFLGGPVIRPIDLDFKTTIDRNGVDSALVASIDKVQLLEAKVHAALNIAALLDDAADPTQTMVVRLKATPLTGTATIDKVAVGEISKALGRSQKLVGTLLLDGKVSGTVGVPDATIKATLSDFGMRKPQLHELSIDAHYVGGVIDAHVVGEENTNTGMLDLKAHADLTNLAAATASLHAQSFDFAPLARLAPDTFLGVAGTLDASLDVTGIDPATGGIDGRVQMTHAELPIAPQIGTLRAGRILVEAHAGDVKISATGTIGDGSVDITAGAKLTGLLPNSGNADIALHNVVLLNAQQPRINGKIHADMTRDASLWHVDAKFTNGDISIPDASGTTLHPVKVPDDIILVAGRKGNEDLVAAAALDRSHAMLGNRPTTPYLIATVTLSPVSVLKKEFRGDISGKLTATVGKDGIALDGDIEADSGDVTLFDRRYQIDHTGIRFDGDIDPVLDILLVHEFPDLTFNVGVRGRLSKPDLQLSADPSTYTQSQLLSFLLGGEPGTDEQPGNNAQAAAAGVGGSIAGGIFKSMVGGYLPVKIDVIRYDAGTDTSSSSFTVGKWINRKLYVAYRQRPESRPDENSNEGELEYWLARRIVLELIAGDRNVDSADLLWTRRW